jgi:hypothetical protein
MKTTTKLSNTSSSTKMRICDHLSCEDFKSELSIVNPCPIVANLTTFPIPHSKHQIIKDEEPVLGEAK